MKVLFVSSGSGQTINGISPIIEAQGESLIRNGVEVVYFKVSGKGIFGYLKSIPRLKKKINIEKVDLVHAHYGLCGIISLFATLVKIPVIISFMGDDLIGGKNTQGKKTIKGQIIKYLNTFSARFYSHIIVKSSNLANQLKGKEVSIIPNGVDLDFFNIHDNSRRDNKKSSETFSLLFLSYPSRPEKNFKLLEQSVAKLNDYNLNIVVKFNLSKNDVLNAFYEADIVCLPSFHEGSPNVVKEAMTLNKVTVATDVGDIKENFNQCSNLFISNDFTVESYSQSILKAIHFIKSGHFSNSRYVILEKGLDSDSVAKKIIKIYSKVCAE